MKTMNADLVYRALQNLNSLEASFLEYSHFPKDFDAYRTYLQYMDHQMIRRQHLSRLYYPYVTEDGQSAFRPNKIADIGEVSEAISFRAGYDLAYTKLFSFPESPLHACGYYSFVCPLEGSGTLQLEKESFSLEPGSFFLIAPHVQHAYSFAPDSLCLCINLRTAYLLRAAAEIFLEDPRLTGFLSASLSETDGSEDVPASWLQIQTPLTNAITGILLESFAVYLNEPKFANHILHHCFCLLTANLLGSGDTVIRSAVPPSHCPGPNPSFCGSRTICSRTMISPRFPTPRTRSTSASSTSAASSRKPPVIPSRHF